MLSLIRRFLDTGYAKVFFVLLIVPFVGWGIKGVADSASGGRGGAETVAVVGDKTVEVPQFQEAYRAAMQEVQRAQGAAFVPTLPVRQAVAGQTLERLIMLAAVADEGARLGLQVPDAAVRQLIFDAAEFKDGTGRFSRAMFDGFLRGRNQSEGQYVEALRTRLMQQQLLEAVRVGAQPPDTLLRVVFGFERETRVAEVVELPFSAAPDPGVADEETVRRAYDNDPQRYAVPAMRHVRVILLSPETVAVGIEPSEADVRAYMEAHAAELARPETRSLEAIVVGDEAAAQRLAALWTGGADWAAMQAAATAAGGTPVALDDAVPGDIPSRELGETVFKATADTVVGPIKAGAGWQLVRVTKITPGTEAAETEARRRLALERAAEEVGARADRMDAGLAEGKDIEELAQEVGAGGFQGTLDARGNRADGEPIPIDDPALRQAVVRAAFGTPKGRAPTLMKGPGNSYFALSVDDETAPQVRPFDQVRETVAENWAADQRRRAEEEIAAKLLAGARAGSLDDAATVAGVHMETTKPVTRQGGEGVPPEVVGPLFELAPGGATMVEAAGGFYVIKLGAVAAPALATDPVGVSQMRAGLAGALGQDVQVTSLYALRERVRPTVNQTLLQSLIQ